MLKHVRRAALSVLCLCAVANGAAAAPVTWSGNGHDYLVVSAPATSWAVSRSQAQAIGNGWDLATITSIGEQAFIAGLLGPSPASPSLVEYYIGGQRANGGFSWVTGETFGFSYWGSGEPNNTSEPFIALDSRYHSNDTPQWGWNDFDGSGASFIAGFVAERHSVPAPGSLAVLLLGGLGLLLTRRRQVN